MRFSVICFKIVITKPFKDFQNLSKPFKDFQNLSKPFKSIENLSKIHFLFLYGPFKTFVWTMYEPLYGSFKTIQRLSKPFKAIQNLSKIYFLFLCGICYILLTLLYLISFERKKYINNKGPNTRPNDTPIFALPQSLCCELIFVLNLLSDKKMIKD